MSVLYNVQYWTVTFFDQLQIPLCWHSWTVPDAGVPEWLQILGCWNAWIVTGTLMLTFLNCYKHLMLTVLNDYRYLDAEIPELLKVLGSWYVWIVTGTLVLTCMSIYRYLDDDMSDLTQDNGILACLNLHGYLVVYMSELFQVPWGADMPELLQVAWCWHVCIVTGSFVLTCLNCCRFLGAGKCELLQISWCWHVWIFTGTLGFWHVWIVTGTLVLTCLNCYKYLGVLTCLNCYRFLGADISELLQVPGCWHVWIVTGTWMLTSVKQHNTGEYMCTAPHMDPVSTLLTVLPGWFLAFELGRMNCKDSNP